MPPNDPIYVIQFITDEPLMIPGSGGVAMRNQLLEIGPGRAGALFPYRSPRGQINHYKRQLYMLIDVVGPDGKRVKNHPDLNVVLDDTEIDDEIVWEPPLQDRGTHVVGESSAAEDVEDAEDTEDVEVSEEEETPKRKKKSSSSRKMSSKRESKKTSKKKK